MRRRSFLLGAAALLVATSADARMHHPYRGHRIVPAAVVDTGPPLDGVPVPSGAYSFRKLRSAYAGPAIRIRRASDNAEIDINFLGFVPGLGAPWDSAAANAHCAATQCYGRTWYNQGTGAGDLTQTVVANQPQLIFNCQANMGCFETTSNTHNINAASAVPATGLVTLSAVGARTIGTGGCGFMRENGTTGNRIAGGSANNWLVGPPTGLTTPAPDGQWHAAIAVLSPTAGQSILSIDNAPDTAGTTVPTTTAGLPGLGGSATTTCRHAEAMFWDNYTSPPAERAAIVANQLRFWVP